MIKIAENSLKYLEAKYSNHYGKEIMIFTTEQEKTSLLRKKNPLNRALSYSKLFLLIYLFFIIIGLIGFSFAFIL